MQQFSDILNSDIRYVSQFIPFSAYVTVGLLFKPDKYTWGGKICEGKWKLFMIRSMSWLSMSDCYHPFVIFFVHVHMKQFYEQGRKSEERIVFLLNKIL
jgi:hypothetical protein